MTPLSAELIAAPAALMLLVAIMWMRRKRDPQVGVHHLAADDGAVQERFRRFASSGRREKRRETAETEVATGSTRAAETVAATSSGDVRAANEPAVAASFEDAVFGPTSGVAADEPDWEAMRLPRHSAPAVPTTEPITESLAIESAGTIGPGTYPADELITRPGWPLPGDLDAWEHTDFDPLVGASMGEPSDDRWSELAAAGPEEPLSDDGGLGGYNVTPDTDAGPEASGIGAPYTAPFAEPPDALSGLMAPASSELGQTAATSMEGIVEPDHTPGSTAAPSADPSFWNVSEPEAPASRAGGPDTQFDATHAAILNGSDAWPPQAPDNGEDWWGTGGSDPGQLSPFGGAAARELEGATLVSNGGTSPQDWWSADSGAALADTADDVPELGGIADDPTPPATQDEQYLPADDRSSRPGELSGMQLPGASVAEATDPSISPTTSSASAGDAWWGEDVEPSSSAGDDWWTGSGGIPEAPATPEVVPGDPGWSDLSVAADPHAAPISTTGAAGLGATHVGATAGEILGAAPVATPTAATPPSPSGARVLPRLDASVHNRNTAGRFAVGGSALGAGDGAFTRISFRAPLERPILGWAIGDGPHHAPGTLVLVVDAVLNCSTAGLSVSQDDGDANRPDGFTLSLSSDGPGPFAVSGSFYVVTK